MEDDFSNAAEKTTKSKQKIRDDYDRKVKPLIEKLCHRLERDGGKFEELFPVNDGDFLIGIGYRVEGSLVSKIGFNIVKNKADYSSSFVIIGKKSRQRNLDNSSDGVDALKKWMDDVAPGHDISEMKWKFWKEESQKISCVSSPGLKSGLK